MRQAQQTTEREVENILSSALKRAQIQEVQAKQAAQLFLVRAREEVQSYVTNEAKEAYFKLMSSVRDVLGEAQSIEAAWKNRTAELWGSAMLSLDEDPSSLFGSLGPGETATADPPRDAPDEAPDEPSAATEQQSPVGDDQSKSVVEALEADVVQQAEPPVAAQPADAPSGEVDRAAETVLPGAASDAPVAPDQPPGVVESTPRAPGASAPASADAVQYQASEQGGPASDDDGSGGGPGPDQPVQQGADPSTVVPSSGGPASVVPPVSGPTEVGPSPQISGEVQTRIESTREVIVEGTPSRPVVSGDSPTGIQSGGAVEVQGTAASAAASPVSTGAGETGDEPAGSDGPADLLGSISFKQDEEGEVTTSDYFKELEDPALADSDPGSLADQMMAEPSGPIEYTGEVDIELAPMANTDNVVKLYSLLQGISTLRILRTAGSSDRGTVIAVDVSQPLPLTELLTKTDELDAEDVAGGDDGSLIARFGYLGAKPEGRARIAVRFLDRVPFVNLKKQQAEDNAISLLPEWVCRKYGIVPVRITGDGLQVAMGNHPRVLRRLRCPLGYHAHVQPDQRVLAVEGGAKVRRRRGLCHGQMSAMAFTR